MTLTKSDGTNSFDFKAAVWNEFDLANVYTRSVKLKVISVYTADSNGFIETEFYGIGKSFVFFCLGNVSRPVSVPCNTSYMRHVFQINEDMMPL